MAHTATEEAVAAVKKIYSRIKRNNERKELQQGVQFEEMVRPRNMEQDEQIQLRQLLVLKNQQLAS